MTSKALSSWHGRVVLTFTGKYDTNIKTGEDYHGRALGDLWGMAPKSVPKANAPAFIPSTYMAFDARGHEAQRERGQFVALTGDIDKGNVPMVDVITHARVLFGSEAAIFIYSTGSATPEDKRWRIIAPLMEPVPFKRWNEAQEAFFAYMDANGVPMDRSLAKAGQPVFLPNVPRDRRDQHGQPNFYETYIAGEMGIAL
jgi:hypothetical protein